MKPVTSSAASDTIDTIWNPVSLNEDVGHQCSLSRAASPRFISF